MRRLGRVPCSALSALVPSIPTSGTSTPTAHHAPLATAGNHSPVLLLSGALPVQQVARIAVADPKATGARVVAAKVAKADPRKRIQQTRNIGIVAHIDAGKTTTTERILFYSGTQTNIGEVDKGTTTTDFLEEETQRGITITSAAVRLAWGDTSVNLIDTPGHVDFAIEVERALRVLDGVVAVFDAAVGVQAQSYTVLRMAKKARTPAIAFINKMDKPNADWRKAVNTLRDKLKVQPVLVQIPLLEDNGEFVGMLDVIRQQKITNGGKHGEELRIEAFASLPTHHQEALRDAKHELIEVLSGRDDDFATAWIMALDKADGDEVAAEALLGPAELIPPLRRAVLKGLASVDAVGGAHNHLDGLPSLLPVLFGAARRNLGVQPLMDAVVDYLPSPLDRPALDGFTATGDLVPVPSPLAPINVGMAFKVMFFPDPKTQKPRALVFTRMYSGSVTKGQRLQNKRTGDVITVEKLYVMQGNTLAEVDSLQSGAIGAFFSDKMATGDTVFAERGSLAHRKAVGGIAEDATAAFHSFEPITPPTPVISHAIEPQSVHEMAELKRCLSCLAIEDPTFTNSENDHGQLVVSAMGELHVEVMVSRLRRHFQVRCELAKAIIEYAESVAEEQVVHDVILHAPGAGGVPVAKLSVAIRPNLQQDELVPSDLVADPAMAAVVTSILPSAEESYKDSVALKFAAAQKMSDDDRKLPREQLLAKVRNQATDRAAKLELRAMRIGLGQAAPSIAKMGKLRLKVKGLEFAIVHAEKIGDELSADDYAKAFVKVLSDTIAHTTNPTVMEPVMDMTVTLSEDQHTQAVFSLLNDRLASYIAVDEEEAGAGTVIKAVVPMRTITRFSGDLRKATKGNAHFWTTLRCYKLVSNDDLRGRILKSLGHSA